MTQRMIGMMIFVFLSTAGVVWADGDAADTDLADTRTQEFEGHRVNSREPEPNTYNVGRSNLRLNKKYDDYNWNIDNEEGAAVPLGNSYGVEW